VSEGSSTPGGAVTAVVTAPNTISLFLADPNGGVYTTSGNAASGWVPWTSVSEGRSTPGAPITAIVTGTNHVTLFLADPLGGVFTTEGSAAGGWAPWTSVSEGSSTPGARVSAVRLRQNQLAVLVADPNGGIYGTWGSATLGWEPWRTVSEGQSAPGGHVTAIATDERHTALFLADPLGGIFTTSGRPYGFRIRILNKIAVTPTVPIATMLANLQRLYDTADILVDIGPPENLTIIPAPGAPPQVNFNIGGCTSGQTPTADQTLLFANRNNAGPNDIVLYYVQATIPAANGCAAFPAGQPGAIIAQGASQWTIAHETGHVLGLNHIQGEHTNCPAATPQCCSTPDFTRLMTGCGTSNITGTPTLVQGEVETMQDSELTRREET
jgi:hypothetical protein